MARPNDGKVADDGTFILNDWGFGGGLKGTFYAFQRNGERICVQNFKANLFNNGLSADGRFAACHTCNSDDERDSAVLAVFDLARGVECARWRPASGWPNFYEFSDDGKTIGLGYLRLGVFRYTMAGEFLDRPAWEEARLTKGDYGDVLMMSQDLIRGAGSKLTPELAARIISAIDRVSPSIHDRKWEALGLKLRGHSLEARGLIALALDCYERALVLDPKIGVKRRTTQLRKIHLEGAIPGGGG